MPVNLAKVLPPKLLIDRLKIRYRFETAPKRHLPLLLQRLLLALLFLSRFAHPALAQETWYQILPTIGTFSSPRLSHLNRDVWVAPHNPNRATGRLVVLSSKTGQLLADVNMPDGREIYMSVSIDFNEANPLASKLIFGTGGETIPGNVYVATLDMVLNGNLLKAVQLNSGATKGFISPPVWVDLNNDHQRDMVVAAVDGRLMAFDGVSNLKLWQCRVDGTEAYKLPGRRPFQPRRGARFFRVVCPRHLARPELDQTSHDQWQKRANSRPGFVGVLPNFQPRGGRPQG